MRYTPFVATGTIHALLTSFVGVSVVYPSWAFPVSVSSITTHRQMARSERVYLSRIDLNGVHSHSELKMTSKNDHDDEDDSEKKGESNNSESSSGSRGSKRNNTWGRRRKSSEQGDSKKHEDSDGSADVEQSHLKGTEETNSTGEDSENESGLDDNEEFASESTETDENASMDRTISSNGEVAFIESPKRKSWFYFLRRKRRKNEADLTPNTDTTKATENEPRQGRITAPAGRQNASELAVSFPQDDKKKNKAKRGSNRGKKISTLGSAARVLTLIIAILLYPLITDEISDRMTVQSFPRMRVGQGEMEVSSPNENDQTDDKTISATLDRDNGKKEDAESFGKSSLSVAPELSFAVPRVQSKAPLSGSSLDRRKSILSFVTDVVNQVGPSVVRVDTETHLQENLRDAPQPPGAYIQQGQGSGLIFSSEGLILTNAHVVEDASKVKGMVVKVVRFILRCFLAILKAHCWYVPSYSDRWPSVQLQGHGN